MSEPLDTRPVPPPQDDFTADELALLARHFTSTDDHVAGLVDLPEVVKGALFARYSRSRKSIRRLFVDEFAELLADDGEAAELDGAGDEVGVAQAEGLYQRVFSQYGDDSVAQLGGAHVAIEEISNLLTKQVEWGRLAAYLEQSTRYIPYDTRIDGRWRYYRDPDVMAGPHAQHYVDTLDAIFATYAQSIPTVLDWVRSTWPQDEATSDFVYRNATKAKALDLLRGLLPAATTSNVGMFASGQSYEMLLLRLQASELAEARHVGERLLTELRQLIPAFLTRVDREDRGVAWSDYLATTRDDVRALAAEFVPRRDAGDHATETEEVMLVDWSPRDPVVAEQALVTAILHPHADRSENAVAATVAGMSPDDRDRVVAAFVGERRNRRHKPGRALERLWYRFDVLGDYGGFRDLQRHRMLTIEWQDLTTRHGHATPPELVDAGVAEDYDRAMERSADLYERLLPDHPVQAQYAVCFGYRIRYTMQLNARAAMQMLELRSTPQGHPAYRRIVQRMHELIRDRAGHATAADAMSHVDHGAAELERLESEKAAERRRG
ncbi:FAD-dependent thymidylate synthase [Salsipaludibacter albus]|uniref:FAD-dependent thymidylate synthase n=1 Tax=Salsipaludibacter albus TaxID=2849650 RepID=UPI001EE473C8|nr:FAD-dependent thymidylate synthase [Salsipaludibacter albus]